MGFPPPYPPSAPVGPDLTSIASVAGDPSLTLDGAGTAATSTHRTLTLPTTTALLSTASPTLNGQSFTVADRYGASMSIAFNTTGVDGININTTTGNAAAASVVGNWLTLFGPGPDISATNPSGSTLLFSANLPGTLGVVTLTTTASNITLGTLVAGTAATGSVTAGGAAGTKAGAVLGQVGQVTQLPGLVEGFPTVTTHGQITPATIATFPLEIGQCLIFDGWVMGTSVTGTTLSVCIMHLVTAWQRSQAAGVAFVTGFDDQLDPYDHTGNTQFGTAFQTTNSGVFAANDQFFDAEASGNSMILSVTGVTGKYVDWKLMSFNYVVTDAPTHVNS